MRRDQEQPRVGSEIPGWVRGNDPLCVGYDGWLDQAALSAWGELLNFGKFRQEKETHVMTRYGIGLIGLVLLGFVAAPVAEGVLVVTGVGREAISEVFVDGKAEDRQLSSSGGGAGSLASFGDLLTNGARTAARSRGDEIAANAQFVDTTFTGGTTYDVRSDAQVFMNAHNLFGAPQEVGFDFFLPPTELELTTNSELADFHVLEARAQAHIEIQYITGGGANAQAVFDFEAELKSNHDALPTVLPNVSASYSVTVNGAPDPPNDMDLSSLLKPTIQRSESNGQRTVTVEIPQFFGHFNLGEVSGLPTEGMSVTYQMSADVKGLALNSEAIAAINDPFALSTDPVIQGVPIFPVGGVLAPEGSVVPEPASVAMGVIGLGALGMAARRRTG